MMHNLKASIAISDFSFIEYIDVIIKKPISKDDLEDLFPKLISNKIYLARTEFNKVKHNLHFIAGLCRALFIIKLIVIIETDVYKHRMHLLSFKIKNASFTELLCEIF